MKRHTDHEEETLQQFAERLGFTCEQFSALRGDPQCHGFAIRHPSQVGAVMLLSQVEALHFLAGFEFASTVKQP